MLARGDMQPVMRSLGRPYRFVLRLGAARDLLTGAAELSAVSSIDSVRRCKV